jgi:cysteine-S-conjugate beta-lyase
MAVHSGQTPGNTYSIKWQIQRLPIFKNQFKQQSITEIFMKLDTILANMVHYNKVKDIYAASHFPIYQTATFDVTHQESDEQYQYSRSGNPTRKALENIFSQAEGGVDCQCTNTGVSALALLFEATLKAEDSVLVERDCYGGTYRILKLLKDTYRIHTTYADFTNIEALHELCNSQKFKLILCESPTNPGLKIIDLKAIAQIARKHQILFAVDNSLATFASQQPLSFGADFSLFSTTKYVSGHGSITAGALVSGDPGWARKIRSIANAQGRAQSPMEVFLLSLGLPTLLCRMRAQEQSALQVAQFLQRHKDVLKVIFPKLTEHPQHTLAMQQMSIIPAVISLEMRSYEKARQLVNRTKLFGVKASFGTSDSRIELPVEISHASFSAEDLAAIGLTKCMVRLSIGLEDVNDLIEDLSYALE